MADGRCLGGRPLIRGDDIDVVLGVVFSVVLLVLLLVVPVVLLLTEGEEVCDSSASILAIGSLLAFVLFLLMETASVGSCS